MKFICCMALFMVGAEGINNGYEGNHIFSSGYDWIWYIIGINYWLWIPAVIKARISPCS